ncbi:helix-turn-helix domain-containing protein [Salmonella enterica subsp. enterica serovar Saintpaul]|uniref:Helix-turn-helix domain-containing protein n=1 Tax=Citrobacter freundii TaxID=546 RepID=A0AAE7GTV6_CITFR|nr:MULTISPECIES: helix-turn-helix domain-containing protein [Citrobacter]EDJ9408103.1 transcriptional regulator [Salmonella enterica]EDQ5105025.1 helix-turn-helix domain-containing protein [Salmonella enterica subsp. enterica serovar Saintpaul]TKV34533.1 helix-turn-helix domain-containing protein [Citrobacter sp. TBCS-11]EEN9709523.1 helix-turn-helix domain-containing protein [Salmonella enterica]EHG2668526.1 helix-turn-helix domain-containing protein [Salmonella enterica]
MKIETLSDRIAARRKELGLTQQQLADLVKKSSVSVFKWESGQTEPKGKSLFALSTALRCSPTWLLFGDEEQIPTPVESLPTALDERQQRLLDLFDSLPESEKESYLNELEARVENFNRLFEELLKVRKSQTNKK